MPAYTQRKRPVVQTAGIKLGLALAAVGASLGGWGALGVQDLTTATQVAQVSSVDTTSGTTTGTTASDTTATGSTTAATANAASTTAATTATQPVARTRSSS